jgi:hypothetical protein
MFSTWRKFATCASFKLLLFNLLSISLFCQAQVTLSLNLRQSGVYIIFACLPAVSVVNFFCLLELAGYLHLLAGFYCNRKSYTD